MNLDLLSVVCSLKLFYFVIQSHTSSCRPPLSISYSFEIKNFILVHSIKCFTSSLYLAVNAEYSFPKAFLSTLIHFLNQFDHRILVIFILELE